MPAFMEKLRQAEECFQRALLSSSEKEADQYVSEIFSHLRSIDAVARENHRELLEMKNFFIEVFQFESLSAWERWKSCPEIYELVQFVCHPSEHELWFREKIKSHSLGLFLTFTE